MRLAIGNQVRLSRAMCYKDILLVNEELVDKGQLQEELGSSKVKLLGVH